MINWKVRILKKKRDADKIRFAGFFLPFSGFLFSFFIGDPVDIRWHMEKLDRKLVFLYYGISFSYRCKKNAFYYRELLRINILLLKDEDEQ